MRRPRLGDLLLLVLAALMVVASVRVISDNFRLRQREPADRGVFLADAPRALGRGHFIQIKAVQPVSGLDLVCGSHAAGAVPHYELCLLLRRHGSVRDRVAGGYATPSAGFQAEVARFPCFGRAIPAHLCPHRSHRHRSRAT